MFVSRLNSFLSNVTTRLYKGETGTIFMEMARWLQVL